jgi:methylmalonyl-CoA/ethylmalonyl-CoA epimerase
MSTTKSPNEPFRLLDNGIAQIAIIVEDLDGTVQNYWETFGVGPWHFYTYQRPLLNMIRYYGEDVDHSFRIALSHLGPMRIELIEVQSGDSIYADFIQDHGYGVQHLGILVEDMEAAKREALNKGFEIIQEGAGFGPDGDGHYTYLDTEEKFGVIYEIIERPKRRHPPEWIYP